MYNTIILELQVESQRDKFTETLIETKKSLEERTNVLKEDLRVVVTRSERAQTMKLLNLQLYDLHMNEEATKTAARWGQLFLEILGGAHQKNTKKIVGKSALAFFVFLWFSFVFFWFFLRFSNWLLFFLWFFYVFWHWLWPKFEIGN